MRFTFALVLFALIAGVAVTGAAATRFADEPCIESGAIRICPGGQVGVSYDVQLQGASGCVPYEYRILNGGLPTGLSLSSSGRISGTPQGQGTANFWVELKDVGCPPDFGTAEREFRITIQPGFRIDNEVTSKYATIGQAYSDQLTATVVSTLPPPPGAPKANATWSLVSGTLPPGLTLAANGLVSGTPTAEGLSTFKVKAEVSGSPADEETFTIDVKQAVTIAATPTSVPKSEVGVNFELYLTATGGEGSTYNWTFDGTLPDGVTFDPQEATVSGTPSEAGSFSFTATAADPRARTATYQGRLVVAQKLAVVQPAPKRAKVGKRFALRLRTTGGVLPKVWKIKKGPLPRGVRFDKSLGVLAGIPTRAGRYRITVEATDSLRVKSTKSFTIVVLAPPAKKRR